MVIFKPKLIPEYYGIKRNSTLSVIGLRGNVNNAHIQRVFDKTA